MDSDRQIRMAADAVVRGDCGAQTYVNDIDREPPVQLMVRGIYSALDAAGSVTPTDLLVRAREDGEAFVEFVNGSS